MIVIPMAGLSSRFTAAGYDVPKYMLALGRDTVFDRAVRSFEAYFETVPFLFIARDIGDTRSFIEAACASLGIRSARIVLLDRATAGQAETVELGLRQAGVDDGTAITIFNVDTFRPGFRFPAAPWWPTSDGYLEVFRGSGANWSYVRTAANEPDRAVETAEKRPISDLCCTGLYHFATAGSFHQALALERRHPSASELYVAPLYNHLIATGHRIHCDEIPPTAILFCGVPAEYEILLEAESRMGMMTDDVNRG